MKYKLAIGVGLVIIAGLVLSGMLLYGQTPQAIPSPTATPGVVVVNTPTPVTFTVDLTAAPTVLANGVNLLRLSSTGAQTIVATMKDDGKAGDVKAGDKIFTAVLNLTEAQPATFRFQVSAAFPGQLKRVLSPIFQFAALAPTTIPVVLPPDPGPTGNTTLAGIDSDHDGVRDDVQRYIIFTYPNSERTRLALLDGSKATRQLLTAPDAPSARAAQLKNYDASFCLAGIISDGQVRYRMHRDLAAVELNTESRFLAWKSADKLAGAQIYTAPSSRKASCTFDPDKVGN